MRNPTQNLIALIALALAVVLEVYLFAASRNDPSLRIAALVSGTALVASLGSISSTLLTGKDVTKPQPQDLPPGGGSIKTTSVVNVPPTEGA